MQYYRILKTLFITCLALAVTLPATAYADTAAQSLQPTDAHMHATHAFNSTERNVSADQIPAPAKQAPLIAGYIEHVAVTVCDGQPPVYFEAKMDTGADSSSMHATDISIDKKNKQVTFSIPEPDGTIRRITCPYTRIVRIKKRPSGYQRRPVINIQLQIGSKRFNAQVNLTDRTNFKYKMLIGRKELRHGILIDSSRHHRLSLQQPEQSVEQPATQAGKTTPTAPEK